MKLLVFEEFQCGVHITKFSLEKQKQQNFLGDKGILNEIKISNTFPCKHIIKSTGFLYNFGYIASMTLTTQTIYTLLHPGCVL